MSFDDMLSATNISSSGLAAERMRMEIVANNIANANSTRTASGGPFRRQEVVFEAMLERHLRAGSANHLRGVRVFDVVDDPSEPNRVFNPGHPDADAEGYVNFPNILLPVEMVNLISASRGYEANLRVLQSFRQMAEQALSLARSSS